MTGYDEVADTTGYVKLPAGGYICKILETHIAVSNYSGRDQLLAYVDIAEGKYSGYFQKQYNDKKQQNNSTRWSNNAIFTRYIIDESTNRVTKALKMFLQSVVKSNEGFSVNPNNFEHRDLIGKVCGFTFGEREYEYNGKIYLTTEIKYPYPVEQIRAGEFKVPPIKQISSAAETTYDNDSVPF